VEQHLQPSGHLQLALALEQLVLQTLQDQLL
jgi:hypothetical protein